ncbi:hypothetical protein A2803_04685 [Candidatus Woesebacteria bacterium RIFCSPHIGHO2_01_FULL_44_21]|uniref:Peptidase C39-like domain-containing protein n=1 Tax=Candidatus Woesebacteria bacterium RIFCSPHIGHO2_01_FULL_44_21 TaxID=1802503 RepID=A0A1F7Z1H5_9BACT|nr:MAG: hypothetical protein A2803_04685 [Candidatus Woesebacteria bacterium RIFCSPHIGHO2_01_FULL_44_21]OGM69414.1 MAG: hypothetical protein A2897_03615 [Candidatus Woesebacteria bacterium RIFCSPLOWO2_01_FULL_44_24b]
MNKILIPIKPLKQSDPNACSVTCLRMILSYYGLEVSNDEIFDFIVKATPEGGSFLSEIGRFANSRGFGVDLYAYNLYLTDPKDADLSEDELLRKLERQLSDSQRDKYYDLMLKSTIDGVKEGVRYIIKKPSFEIIKEYLNNGIPLSIRLNYASLVNKQGDPFDSHDVVLSGREDKKVRLVDPEDASEKLFDYQDLMFSISQSKIISASAYLLAVTPK